MISGDSKASDPRSGVFQRLLLQAGAVDSLIVLAPMSVRAYTELGAKGSVYGFKGSKPHVAFTMLEFVRRAARGGEHLDVVTTQDPFFRGLVGWRAAQILGTKLNVQVHADLAAQSFLKRAIARFVLRRADSVRVVSERVKAQVRALGVIAPIHVLPIFVDVSTFRSIVRREHTQPTILWLGRFEKEKNPLAAIDVLEKVRAQGIDARLVMLGSGSMTRSVMKRAANRPVVEVLTWQDPRAHMETADVVLCTSWSESWGASIVEALAAGVPVVAPDVGVAKEAGAFVMPREKFADEVARVLREQPRGELKLALPNEDAWSDLWSGSIAAPAR